MKHSTVLGLAAAIAAVSANRFLPREVVENREMVRQGLIKRDNGVAWRTELTTDEALTELIRGVKTLQSVYFDTYSGTWPDGDSWTRAAIAAQMAASVTSASHALLNHSSNRYDVKIAQTWISDYTSHMLGYYYGQDQHILWEKNDDQLWVVLGWLEMIKLINVNSQVYNLINGETPSYNTEITNMLQDHWFAKDWEATLAHRARIMWEHVKHAGWDTTQCDGGVIWDPWVSSDQWYKNTITNQLFISASASMYQNWPGDLDINDVNEYNGSQIVQMSDLWGDGDKSNAPNGDYQGRATDTYTWLANHDLKDSDGLYYDGWNDNCTTLNKGAFIYTYNQGAILHGQRALYEITGDESYLSDAHTLIQNVVHKTGWNLTSDAPYESDATTEDPLTNQWGIGRLGVMEDACDADQSCDHNTMIFKGVFWHNLALFCAPFDNAVTFTDGASDHTEACKSYINWAKQNAIAVLGTKADNNAFGMWWTWGLFNNATDTDNDVNAKGQGRRVEAHASGLSAIRAYFELAYRLG